MLQRCTSTRSRSLVLALATVAADAAGLRQEPGPEGQPGAPLPDRRDPEGHDPRVLAHDPRRRHPRAARPRREGRPRRDHLEGAAARGRPRAAGPGGRVLREPGHRRHRARAARRQGARAPGRGGGAAQGPDRDHGLGARLRPDRELRRHRQLQGRRDGRRRARPGDERQGQDPAAALRGGLGQHRRPRGGLPRRGARRPGRGSSSSPPTSTPAPRATPPSAPPRTC